MTENEFQQAVIELARYGGWRVYHARPAQIRPGVWATPFTGAAGFPDLILAHPHRGLLASELKVGRNKPTDDQLAWLEVLDSQLIEAAVWRPEDLDYIARRLHRDMHV